MFGTPLSSRGPKVGSSQIVRFCSSEVNSKPWLHRSRQILASMASYRRGRWRKRWLSTLCCTTLVST